MLKFTKTDIFCMAHIIIFFIFQIVINQYSVEIAVNEEIMEGKQKEKIESTEPIELWKIEIPQILLVADISEGTSKEVLNQAVGHFEETSKKQGNIGLASYNSGGNINYFKDLKLLKKGDEIRYKYNQFEKIYEVKKCRIIKSTEWKYLQETEENMLTLITYVENQPEYRRCIQAIEKEIIITDKNTND